MPIQVLNDVILPHSIIEATGVHGKSIRVNQRTAAPNGQRSVNIQQDRSRRQYEFGSVHIRQDVLQALQGVFEVTEAGAFGFLLEDPSDSVATTGPCTRMRAAWSERLGSDTVCRHCAHTNDMRASLGLTQRIAESVGRMLRS